MKGFGAIVLAAGGSTRLGQPKQLLMLGGETLLERAVRVAAAVCDPVVVVLGARAGLIQSRCDLGGAVVTVNEAWSEGMGSSIRCGLREVGSIDGVVILTCDMPAVTARHLGLLIASGGITGSAYAERRGVPGYFPASTFPELLGLEGEGGARALLEGAPGVELMLGELDIDTIEDFERATEVFGGRAELMPLDGSTPGE